jgi:hypothetical protein
MHLWFWLELSARMPGLRLHVVVSESSDGVPQFVVHAFSLYYRWPLINGNTILALE